MKFILVILLFFSIGCYFPGNSLYEHADNSANLELWQKTGKIRIVSPCGLFMRETSRYKISLPALQDKYSFSEISLTCDDSIISLSSGSIEIIKPDLILVNLYEKKNQDEVALKINGKHKFKKVPWESIKL